MSFLKFATVLAASAFLGSCGVRDYNQNPCELKSQVRPIKLMGDELSYTQLEKYAELFSDPSFQWIERAAYPDRGGLSVDRFSLKRTFMGHMGEIEYVFYFRRLAEMRFHPDNASDFFQTVLIRKWPTTNDQKLEIGDLKYWASRRSDAVFFGAEDSRITRSHLACIAAYD
jgi:hypothetical protein